MADKRDYYDVLGLKKGASEDEIRKAYRSLAKKYHPDVSSEPDAESKFKEVQACGYAHGFNRAAVGLGALKQGDLPKLRAG
jgi:hypothetical protein